MRKSYLHASSTVWTGEAGSTPMSCGPEGEAFTGKGHYGGLLVNFK